MSDPNDRDKASAGTGGKPSLSLANLFWPLLLAAYSIYRLVLTRPLPLPTMLWYGFIAVLSVLLVFAVLLGRAAGTPKEAAKSIDDMNRAVYAGVHERRSTDESTITEYRLDLGFYRRSTEALENLGFRTLADYVDVTMERATPWAKAVIRSFLHVDGKVMAGVFDIRMSGWQRSLQVIGLMPRSLRAIDMETELSDGSFVTTSDAVQAGKTLEFPGISRRFLPAGTSPADLSVAHRDHLRDLLAQKTASVIPLVLRSFADLCASQDRLQLLKSSHRSSAAFDAAAQLARIAGRPLTDPQSEMAREVADLHAQRVREEQQGRDAQA
jgi:hypothetical protein